MGIDHVGRFNNGVAGSMNNTKFRRIDAFCQLCLQCGGQSVALHWLSIQYHEPYEQHSRSLSRVRMVEVRVLLKVFPTFFTGHACLLLQFNILQVEGVAVVSERHPRPLSQRVGALAGVDPLVNHGLIWQGEKQQRLIHLI